MTVYFYFSINSNSPHHLKVVPSCIVSFKFNQKNEPFQNPFPNAKMTTRMENLFLSKNKQSGVHLPEVLLESQKDVQNYKKCKRKSQRELNCSAQENGNDLLFFTLEGKRAEDMREEEREQTKKEGKASKRLLRAEISKTHS